MGIEEEMTIDWKSARDQLLSVLMKLAIMTTVYSLALFIVYLYLAATDIHSRAEPQWTPYKIVIALFPLFVSFNLGGICTAIVKLEKASSVLFSSLLFVAMTFLLIFLLIFIKEMTPVIIVGIVGFLMINIASVVIVFQFWKKETKKGTLNESPSGQSGTRIAK